MGPDVIVVGAGAAGLACRRELLRAGLRVVCLEARDRIGGRIYTIHDPRCGVPVELGAEFVHGLPPQIAPFAEWHRLHIEETSGRMIDLSGSEEDGDRILEAVKRHDMAQPDESFAAFLARSGSGEAEKAAATGFVEGFNAARKEEVSVASLAKDMRAGDEIDGDRAFRISEGYHALVRALAGNTSDLRTNCEVAGIEWRPGECRVRLAAGEVLESRAVVVTVPLGVLLASSIRFDPVPREALEAAGKLRFGNAVRVTLQFERAFWEGDPELDDPGFLFGNEPVFPVWWSRLPARVPILTGWSAGPKADVLMGLSAEEVAGRALETLRRLLGSKVPAVTASWYHDWQADRYSRGAYSWVPAGALPARETLARPVAETLYFAGEATDMLGYGGTVHGAMASGQRAARQIIENGIGD